MTYTFNMPFDGQSLGNSKPQVRANFNYIASSFAINHQDYNTATVGMHKFVQMPEQVSDPTTGAAIGDLYTKTAQSFTNLFWRQESGGADPLKDQAAIIQMTNLAPTNAAKGSTFLPGGLLLQWNTRTLATSGSTVTATFLNEFQIAGVAANPYAIMLTAQCPALINISALSLGASNITSLGFDINRFGGTGSLEIMYIAIGPRT